MFQYRKKKLDYLKIIDHLNKGSNLFENEQEKINLAKLNLKAGQRARLSTAYQEAFEYTLKGILLLGKDSWQKEYKLSLSLFEIAAEAAYLTGNFEHMESYATEVIENSKDVLDALKVYEMKLAIYSHQQEYIKAIKIGQEILAKLGVHLPRNPTKVHILIGFVKTQLLLKGKSITDIYDLPEMEDKHAAAIVQIMVAVSSSAYIHQPLLFPLIVFTTIKYLFHYGHHPLSSFGFATYGIILSAFQKVDKAYQIGELALRLLDKHKEGVLKGRTGMIVMAFTFYGEKHIRESLPLMKDFLQDALEEGDLEYLGYLAFSSPYYGFLGGVDLPMLEQELDAMAKLALKAKQEYALGSIQIIRQTVSSLINIPTIGTLNDEFSDKTTIPFSKIAENNNGLFNFFFFRTIKDYIFRDYQQANINAKEANKYLVSVQGQFSVYVFCFFDALTLLALYPQASKKQRRIYLKKVKKHLARLKKLAKHAYINFQHKYDLIIAERARVLGKKYQAMEFYQKAITGAKENQFLPEEAIANERASEFYFDLALGSLGLFHLGQAYYLYFLWGAKAKVNQLEELYPRLLSKALQRTKASSSFTRRGSITITNSQVNDLDFTSLIKASQTLSGEIKLDHLASKLMHIVMENAGAERAILLLDKSGEWFFEAASTIDKNQAKILQSRRLADLPNDATPKSVTNYIIRTKEAVVLDNASEEGDFTEDPHIKKYKSKSLLGLPIMSQGKLIGILGLQNFQAIGVFTPDRLQILETIIAQVAISMENARLYENLEQLVLERTEELTQALNNLQKVVLELEDKNEEILYLSCIDPLTDLYNRRQFDTLLKGEWQRSKREISPLSLMIIDVDFFKSLNDTYGHQQGDDCLKAVAKTIRQTLRRPSDAAIRYGGDEFIAILPNTNLSGSSTVAKNILNNVQKLDIKNQDSKIPQLTVSIGIATTIPSGSHKMEDLLAEADRMLYQVKEAGRNQFKSTFISHDI